MSADPAATPPEARGGWVERYGAIPASLGLALLYLGAAKFPFPSDLTFEAYLFWPAAALVHTAYFILGPRAWLGIALGSALLNWTSWLPWPYALAMTVVQTLEPLAAWRIMVLLGCPRPDLRRVKDLLTWAGVATLCSVVFSAGLGSLLMSHALPLGFKNHLATAFSWFLGDAAAILCLGPALLLCLRPGPSPALPPKAKPLLETLAIAALCLTLLLGSRLDSGFPRDVRLALQFALFLPLLWMSLRLGPRATSLGIALLTFALLIVLWGGGKGLAEEAFRFSQLFLLVLALGAQVGAAATEEARSARRALGLRELQAQRMEAVGTLAGGLVHEFNNQLTVILGNLDRAQELVPAQGPGPSVLHRIEDAALAMGRRIHQLKALSHQAPVQALSLRLSEALSPFLASAREIPPRITFSWHQDDDPVVGVDPDLLAQALHHLLANSLEAIQGQGHITLRARQDGPWVRLGLEDTGAGMAPEVLERACDPFFTTKPLASGRGLGLSIVFSLVRQMGGGLVLISQPGQGTRAEISLPLGQPGPKEIVPAFQAHPTHQILLADDESGIRELTKEFLESEGFAVVEACDGPSALEAFQSDPQAWDLVILDLVMPRMGGADALALMEAQRPDLPALMISGYSAELRPGLLGGPHRAFLAKPFRLQQLKEAMTSLGVQAPSPGNRHDR